jgi:hypothetical protein
MWIRAIAGSRYIAISAGAAGLLIFVKTAMAPGKVVVKAGTLDSMEELQPQTEIYTDHAVKWLAPVAGATRFAQNP